MADLDLDAIKANWGCEDPDEVLRALVAEVERLREALTAQASFGADLTVVAWRERAERAEAERDAARADADRLAAALFQIMPAWDPMTWTAVEIEAHDALAAHDVEVAKR